MTRKICVVTGSRAEYGLLRWILHGIVADPSLKLQLVVTGAHLSPEFGLTYREIVQDGIAIDRKVEMLMSSDTAVGVAKSMGLAMGGFADAFADLEPDLLLVLGDRFEIFAAVATALVARIPVAHLHGGEATEGAFDEALRHAITKMSHLHFVAADAYRRRVIQLGERPERVFVVGGLGVDGIRRSRLLDRDALEAALGFDLGRRSLLVTFQPVTLGTPPTAEQMGELLAALSDLRDTRLIFTLPNADTDGRALIGMIEAFVAQHPNARAFASLGQQRYLSCMAQVDGVVGNSSSGLLEAPSFRKPAVNIGDRQRGRLQAASVINCAPVRREIAGAIARIYDPDFQAGLASVTNPYGEGGASEKVLEIIKHHDLEALPQKVFYDLPDHTGPGVPT
jgi:GDP/UDP-N,N'-diacetylbacillosamine 2-epimerase (hydrolysing)